MITISVIIPAYNCSGTIRDTVSGIFMSGLTDYEIIIVDDGSTDGTDRICDELSSRHECIRCIHQKNAGASAARNRGVAEARGEYIWFFDADDSVQEKSMIRVEEVLRDLSPDMLVFGARFDYYHKSRCYRSDEYLPPVDGMKSASDCSDMLYELFRTNSLSALWNRITKGSVITGMDTLLREEMFLYEDLEFVLRALKRCDSVYFLREAIYHYRQSEDGGNAGRRLKRIAHLPELMNKIEEALGEEKDKNRILLALYLILAREKVSVSTKADIETVCNDFRHWIDAHAFFDLIKTNEYAQLLYNRKTTNLLIRKTKSIIRHGIANGIKKTIGDYRKW